MTLLYLFQYETYKFTNTIFFFKCYIGNIKIIGRNHFNDWTSGPINPTDWTGN